MAQKKVKVELSVPEAEHVLKAIEVAQYQHGLNSGSYVRQLTTAASKIRKAQGAEPDSKAAEDVDS